MANRKTSSRAKARQHLRHHVRFYVAAALGTAILAGTGDLASPLRLLLAGDGFFTLYLLQMAVLARQLSVAHMRRRASFEDEGVVLILSITPIVVAIDLVSIFLVLNRTAHPGAAQLALAFASVLLGWLTLHTMAAFHYAHVYYARAADGGGDAGGLQFPATPEPACWDFLYYAFVIGMTAQVSDVAVTSTVMRKLTLGHGVLSFMFNTVLLALAINVAANLAN